MGFLDAIQVYGILPNTTNLSDVSFTKEFLSPFIPTL